MDTNQPGGDGVANSSPEATRNMTEADPLVATPKASESEVRAIEERGPASPTPPHADQVQWTIGWKLPTKILSLLVAGILFAVGHHLYYCSLESKPVRTQESGAPAYDSQEWIGKFGFGFAFATKALLAGAVEVAYKQQVWFDLRRRAYKIESINAMYDATSNALAFFNAEFIGRTTLAAILAALVWTIPLTAIVTPSTLLVVLSNKEVTTRTVVPMVNLANGGIYRLNGMPADVAPLLTRITTATASAAQVLSMSPAIPNATYEVKFLGPSLKCESATGATLEMIDNVVDSTSRGIASTVGGQAVYVAFTPHSRYWQSIWNGTGYTFAWNYTALAESCVIGNEDCGYNPTQYTEEVALWPLLVSLNDSQLACSLQNTSYTMLFDSAGGEESHLRLQSYEHIGRTNSTLFAGIAQGIANILTGVIGHATNMPAGSQSMPQPLVVSRRTRVTETALIGAVNGVKSRIGTANVINIPEEDLALSRNLSIGALIEELSRNQTMSLFSDARTHTTEGVSVDVTQRSPIRIWRYDPRNLWVAYGLAIFFASLGALVGLRAMYTNGVSHDMSFFATMATTRNPTLDELVAGESLGRGDQLGKEIAQTRLLFGALRGIAVKENVDIGGRAGFGLPTEVARLTRRQPLY